jgi:hypothetical protein
VIARVAELLGLNPPASMHQGIRIPGFKSATDVGVWQTFLTMGAIYFSFMMIGAFRYHLPPTGWRPDGWTPPAASNAMISQHNVHLKDAHKTPQFWLIWWVLCLNVSAGIGVIGMASPMLQEIFAGSLIGLPDVKFNALTGEQRVAIAAIAAGFTGLLSLFNIAGRFFWASLSDYSGARTPTTRSSSWASRSTPSRRWRPASAPSCCSWPASASSCRCTAGGSQRCLPISPTCSARSSWAPSTAGC